MRLLYGFLPFKDPGSFAGRTPSAGARPDPTTYTAPDFLPWVRRASYGSFAGREMTIALNPNGREIVITTYPPSLTFGALTSIVLNVPTASLPMTPYSPLVKYAGWYPAGDL